MTTSFGLKEKDDKQYVNILGSDGTLRMVVPEGTLGCVRRDYESSDGKTGTKHELVFKEIGGYITDLELYDGDYGVNLIITIAINEDRTEHITISVGTGTPFGEDLMKKLPNVDLEKPVTLIPYAFLDENGKNKKGITVMQEGNKLTNFFYDKEKEKNLHGFPTPKGDTKKYSKDKWKAYFLEARIFLTDYVKEHIVEAKFGNTVTTKDDDF